jgi:ATP-dependent DNA ligase
VPAALRPPVELALAKAVESIPHAGALPGGNVYEMKWDGFRAVCVVDVDGVSLWSRQRKDLSSYFPDVLAAAGEQIPTGCVVDGELVVWSGDQLDFDALQLRLVTARAALPALVRERPASFVAFDVLAVAGEDARGLPFRDRRALLEELARAWVPPLNLSPVTRDRAVAETWFKEMPAMKVEGILIKGDSQPYEPRRIWLKVKAEGQEQERHGCGVRCGDRPCGSATGVGRWPADAWAVADCWPVRSPVRPDRPGSGQVSAPAERKAPMAGGNQ